MICLGVGSWKNVQPPGGETRDRYWRSRNPRRRGPSSEQIPCKRRLKTRNFLQRGENQAVAELRKCGSNVVRGPPSS